MCAWCYVLYCTDLYSVTLLYSMLNIYSTQKSNMHTVDSVHYVVFTPCVPVCIDTYHNNLYCIYQTLHLFVFSLLYRYQSSRKTVNKSVEIELNALKKQMLWNSVSSSFSTCINLLKYSSKSVCDYIILPMEMNSKYMHELIVLAQSVPFPLKLSMSEVFPGPRTNYSEPSAVPGAKVIMWVSLSWPYGSSSSATYLQELNRAEGDCEKYVAKLNVPHRLRYLKFGASIIFINNNICATHFAEEQCLIKAPKISVKQILTAFHRSVGSKVVIIKNTAYLRENFLL